MTSREVDRVMRQFADQQTRKFQAIPDDGYFQAKVTTITAGAATDGNALVKVTYRGTEFPVIYPDTYTPVANDRVLCLSVNRVPRIVQREIGHP